MRCTCIQGTPCDCPRASYFANRIKAKSMIPKVMYDEGAFVNSMREFATGKVRLEHDHTHYFQTIRADEPCQFCGITMREL